MAVNTIGSVITITGSETDLSNYNGVTGVTFIDTGKHRIVLIQAGYSILIDSGASQKINPEYETLIFDVNADLPHIINRGVLIIGTKTVVGGEVRYSAGVAVVASHNMSIPANIFSEALFRSDGPGSEFYAYGGTIISSTGMSIGGWFGNPLPVTCVIESLHLVSTRVGGQTPFRFDNNAGDSIDCSGLILDGEDTASAVFFATDFVNFAGEFRRGYIQTQNDQPSGLTLRDLMFRNNIHSADVVAKHDMTQPDRVFTFYNIDVGMAMRTSLEGGGNKQGFFLLRKEINLTLTLDGLPITSAASVWTTESDDGNRSEPRNGTTISPGGTVIADYTSVVDGSGVCAFDVRLGIFYGAGAAITPMNTSYFSDGGDDNDLFTFYHAGYATLPSSRQEELKGTGTTELTWAQLPDAGVTNSDRAAVDAYSLINDWSQLYDRAKSYWQANPDWPGRLQTIFTAEGLTIQAGSVELWLDASLGVAMTVDTGNSRVTVDTSGFADSTEYAQGDFTGSLLRVLSGTVFSGTCRGKFTADAGATFSGALTLPAGSTGTFASDAQAAGGSIAMTGGALVIQSLSAHTLALATGSTGTIEPTQAGAGTLNLRDSGNDLSGLTIDYAGVGAITVQLTYSQLAPTLNNTGAGSLTIERSGTQVDISLNPGTSAVLVLDDSDTVQQFTDTETGTFSYEIPSSASGTWKFVVKTKGYVEAQFTKDADGVSASFDAGSVRDQQPDGTLMYQGASTALLTVTSIPATPRLFIDIGDGAVSPQQTYDAVEDALFSQLGLEYLYAGGERCSLALLPGGNYWFQGIGVRLRVRTPGDGATLNAFAISTESVVQDTSNGSVQFISTTDGDKLAAHLGAVWVDTAAGESGTAFPIGTLNRPVDNIPDALTIAANLGMLDLAFISDATITQNVAGYSLRGAAGKVSLTLSGADISGARLQNVALSGSCTASDETTGQLVSVDGLTGFAGNWSQATFTGTTEIAAGATQIILEYCSSAVAGSSRPAFDLSQLTGDCAVNVRNWNGGFELQGSDRAGNTISVNLTGSVVVGPTNTAGELIVEGTGRGMTDTSGASFTVDETGYNAGGSGGGTADWTTGEREQIRNALGVAGDQSVASGGQLQTLAATVAGVKSQTDQLAFTGGDVHATLDGEEVTTDAASRTASQANTAGLALESSVQSVKTQTDKLTFNGSNEVLSDPQQLPAGSQDVNVVSVSGVAVVSVDDFKADVSGLSTLDAADVENAVTVSLTNYDPPTKAELDAAVAPLSTFDPTSDVVAQVTLVDTVTTNADMRGTDDAMLAVDYVAPDNASAATAAQQATLGRKLIGNRLLMDEGSNTMNIYDDDGTTVLQAYLTYDQFGNPSTLNIFERVPQ